MVNAQDSAATGTQGPASSPLPTAFPLKSLYQETHVNEHDADGPLKKLQVTYCEFSDKTYLHVTDRSCLGSLHYVTLNLPAGAALPSDRASLTSYIETRVLLGDRNDALLQVYASEVYAGLLLRREGTQSSHKPLLFSLGLGRTTRNQHGGEPSEYDRQIWRTTSQLLRQMGIL